MNRNCTILVADDDADDREIINEALSALPAHFEIVNVENGLEVMDYLFRRGRFAHVTNVPDFIFLDLNMPLLDGFEVLKGIRIQQALTSIPVYVLTVSRNPADESRARKLGATGFFNKGAKARDLAETIQMILDSRKDDPTPAAC